MSKTWQKVRGLGWLSFPAAVLVLLAILCLTWSTPVLAQATWNSYQDAGHTIPWGAVGEEYNATYHIVYMWGDYFTKNTTHHVGYYDNAGTRVAEDLNISVLGNEELSSEYDIFVGGVGTPGTWHASAYEDPNTPPATYDGTGVTNDAFEVLPEAIPEFPTVLSAIAVATLCGVAYLWMRKKTGYAQA